MSRTRRSGEKKRKNPASQAPANAIHSELRIPIPEPNAPPRRPPNGRMPHVTHRLAAFIFPRFSGGQTDCR